MNKTNNPPSHPPTHLSKQMDNPTGQAIYQTAGRLNMPVGFMLFKGLNLHLPEVTHLLSTHPLTPAIIDHWGFFHQDGRGRWVGGWVDE